MHSNYDDVLAQLRAGGLLVDTLETGRVRRCRVEGCGREKRGWYILHTLRLDNGDEVLAGSFGAWHGAQNHAQKVQLNIKTKQTPAQIAALRERLALDREAARVARLAETRRAAQRAQAAWAQCRHVGDCDYLHRKGVAAHGVRFSPQGAMVIPMMDAASRIYGLQIIRGQNRRSHQREKEFWPAGLEKRGKFSPIGAISDAAVVLVAEGYATAASLHEATGLPTVVAFDAGNLQHVVHALTKRWRRLRILICADDDQAQKCHSAAGNCRAALWLADGPHCGQCGQEHRAQNAGVECAQAAALAVGGAWIAPQFAPSTAARTAWLEAGRKISDFNDLHAIEGLHVVREQIQRQLQKLRWGHVQKPAQKPARSAGVAGAADAAKNLLAPIECGQDLLERFVLVYGQTGVVFDRATHRMISINDMGHLCANRRVFNDWRDSPQRQIVMPEQVGFDPSETDPTIECNLWGGWPQLKTTAGANCEKLLELLRYMCSAEGHILGQITYEWVLNWLAYPLQNPGAKMKTTLVVHGPQGTGKNLFFETYMKIYGPYGWTINQDALEDKFNDWASRKLFLIADEVVARSEMFHVKNKLKAFITSDQVRINPKNMAAYYEKNHVNMVFLSNEMMPVVLEEDDRRHCIIWTPAKLEKEFYLDVIAEIKAGGVAALRDYLMARDVGDFDAGTLPPQNAAKAELVELSLDSPSKFFNAFTRGHLSGFPAAGAPAVLLPALTTDLYDLYKVWCEKSNERAMSLARFVNTLKRRHEVDIQYKRYEMNYATKNAASFCFVLGGNEKPAEEKESEWLGTRVEIFRMAAKEYRTGA